MQKTAVDKKKYAKTILAACAVYGATFLTACSITDRPMPDQAAAFQWESSEPLIVPPSDGSQTYYGVKDPSIVRHNGKYHVFMTTAGSEGWAVAYTSFHDREEASQAPITGLDKSPMGPGYRAAPQVFYFEPQDLWYLVYQGGPPLYSTSRDISDPLSWSAPTPYFETPPEIVKDENGHNAWLDFWNICDDETCYQFFTNDKGDFFRAETPLDQFPNGFHNTTLVMQGDTRDDLFEASNTYKIAGTNKYLTLIEAIGLKGRYFRAWTSDSLAGNWQPLTPDPMNVFADSDNVGFDGRIWSGGVSHGEMIRASSDQTLTIDPCKPLQYLYQGLDMNEGASYDYIELPYKLGILTASAPNPISQLCSP